MTRAEAVRYIARRLEPVSDSAREEARIIVRNICGTDTGGIFLDQSELGADDIARLEGIVERRLKREPLQYVLGEWGFMGFEFTVGPAALIPRQDTETLCEEAVRLIRERGYRSLLDICTGTGCIAISIQKLTGIKTEASDISEECVRLAKENANKNGALLTVRKADLFEGAGTYDIVTANPPYVSDADMEDLQEEVKYEPALALAGGSDGLDVYRRIAKEAGGHIAPGGVLLLEVGMGEAEAVAALFPERGTAVIKDLNGVERVVRIDF